MTTIVAACVGKAAVSFPNTTFHLSIVANVANVANVATLETDDIKIKPRLLLRKGLDF